MLATALKIASRSPLATRLTAVAAAFLLKACADDSDTPPEEEPFKENRPDDRVAPRNCRYNLKTYVDPQEICLIQNIDRLQLPSNWDEAELRAETEAMVDFASFAPAESSSHYTTVCGSAQYSQYFDDCGRSRALADARRFGRDLNQQCFWVPDLDPKDMMPEVADCWGSIFTGAGILTSEEAMQLGPVWWTTGLFEFNNPEDPSVADITLDFETTVEELGRYGMSLDRFYMEGFPTDQGCVPVEGVEVDIGGGQVFKIPTFMDGEAILLTQGISCFFDNVSGAGTYQATCCEGEECHPPQGITVERVRQELEIICDGQDASP